MATISIDPSCLCDAEELAFTMRQYDKDEILASGGLGPYETLKEALALSELKLTVRVDGLILAMLGVQRIGVVPDVVMPWALTSCLVTKYPKVVYSLSKLIMVKLLNQYPIMINYVDARHTKAVSWARRIGFSVSEEPEPYGVGGLPFYRISTGGM